jgi:hypothetical protein
MRGYLQQMIAAAAGLEQTVHPLIGNIFEGTASEETVGTSARIERTNAVDRERGPKASVVDRQPQAMDPGAEPVQPKPPTKADQVVVPTRASTSVPGKTPKIRKTGLREQESDEPRQEEHLRPSQVHQSANLSREQTRNLSTKEEVLPEAEPVWQRPLLVHNRPKKEPIGEEIPNRRPMQRASALEAYPARNHVRKWPTLKHEQPKPSEDVQIHIGRIEVVAVPPAPAPPPAKPVRRSLNLQEYLKRQDGRRP